MTDNLHDRWITLVEAIARECVEHGQHPDVLEIKEPELKIRLPIPGGSWYPKVFTIEEVLHGDLRLLAAQFYAGYQMSVDICRAPA